MRRAVIYLLTPTLIETRTVAFPAMSIEIIQAFRQDFGQSDTAFVMFEYEYEDGSYPLSLVYFPVAITGGAILPDQEDTVGDSAISVDGMIGKHSSQHRTVFEKMTSSPQRKGFKARRDLAGVNVLETRIYTQC